MKNNLKQYNPHLSASLNRKGVLDIDTVKGCELGMVAHPSGGCYGLCYAQRMAKAYGYNFSKSVSRKINGNHIDIERIVKKHHLSWFRTGNMGDPSHDWDNTIDVCEWLGSFKTPVVISKHWVKMSNDHAISLKKCNTVVNTSVSPLDTKEEIEYRINIFKWLKEIGINSVLRIVSAMFGDTENGNELKQIQDKIFKNTPIIENPVRIPMTDKRVVSSDSIARKKPIRENRFTD